MEKKQQSSSSYFEELDDSLTDTWREEEDEDEELAGERWQDLCKKPSNNKPGVTRISEEEDESHTEDDDDEEDRNVILLEQVARDNLDLMYEVCMRIREDKEYAKSIYANCPRLQHLLDQHPDLRPVFEEPNLVRINFEDVYRKAGGDRLPEDRPNRVKKILVCIVRHPLFRVLRIVIMVKKIATCITGGGFAAVRSWVTGCLCASSATAEALPTTIGGADPTEDPTGWTQQYESSPEDVGMGEGNPANLANKEALYRAADYMEQNEEQMQKLLTCDPDQFADMVEQDPELRALRDSNPLCYELMSDQSTMTILADPDNLRALAECPDLIEADFSDPNWEPPPITDATFDDGYVNSSGDVETGALHEVLENEGSANLLEGFEMGEGGTSSSTAMRSSRGSPDEEEGNQMSSRMKDFARQGFSGLLDTVVANATGIALSEFMLGGDDGLDALVDDAADQADSTAVNIESAAEFMTSDNVADYTDRLEDTLDKFEEQYDDMEMANNETTAAAVGRARGQNDDDNQDELEEEPKRRRGIGGVLSQALSSAATSTKEFAASLVLGEDLAESLVEKLEERKEENEQDEEKKLRSANRSLRR
jgi:hypothetical protein